MRHSVIRSVLLLPCLALVALTLLWSAALLCRMKNSFISFQRFGCNRRVAITGMLAGHAAAAASSQVSAARVSSYI